MNIKQFEALGVTLYFFLYYHILFYSLYKKPILLR